MNTLETIPVLKTLTQATEIEVRQDKSREEEVREQIAHIKTSIESRYLDLAYLLKEVKDNGYHIDWGYKNFVDYADKELGLKARKAFYLISIADTVSKFDLDRDKVVAIGWTKMRMIAPYLKESNISELFELAETNSASNLSMKANVISANLEIENADQMVVEAVKPVKITLSLRPEVANIVLEAIEQAKLDINTESVELALEHICYEWASSNSN